MQDVPVHLSKFQMHKLTGMNSRFQSRVVPARRAMPAACTSVYVDKVMAFSAPTLARTAGMALRVGTARDWKREFIQQLLLAGACAL